MRRTPAYLAAAAAVGATALVGSADTDVTSAWVTGATVLSAHNARRNRAISG